MKHTTACAVFVTTIVAIASQLNVVVSSASVLDEADPPKTRKVRTAIILRFIIYTLLSYRIVSYLNFCFVCFLFLSLRCLSFSTQKIKNGKKDSNSSSGSTGKPNGGSLGHWWGCGADGCPGIDCRVKNRDHECPFGQEHHDLAWIMCTDFWTAGLEYCYERR